MMIVPLTVFSFKELDNGPACINKTDNGPGCPCPCLSLADCGGKFFSVTIKWTNFSSSPIS